MRDVDHALCSDEGRRAASQHLKWPQPETEDHFKPRCLQARVKRVMEICYFVCSVVGMELGIRGTRWKSTDSINGLWFGDIHFKLLKAE